MDTDEEEIFKAEMDKVKVNKGTEVTEEDVIGAFDRGRRGEFGHCAILVTVY